MSYSVTIFSPDSHLSYDLSILDEKGIGGGATTRVRMAHALAKRGNEVKLYINCPEEKIENGVRYLHFSKLKVDESDVFIASTSGGSLDLRCLEKIKLGKGIKIILVHGVGKPQGLESFSPDYCYVPSNFIRQVVISEWQIPGKKTFVTHRGVEEKNYIFGNHKSIPRDPWSMIYASYPSKGLETATAVFQLLREKDSRFSLHVFGGYGLWGEERQIQAEDQTSWHGLVGQKFLATEMQKCKFSLCLQDREEPFGMTVIESMRSGCIVIASPVGAYPEIISNGYNGFLLSGIHTESSVRNDVVELIFSLSQNNDYCEYVQNNAIQSPKSWDQISQTWEGHWHWILNNYTTKFRTESKVIGTCPGCRSEWLAMADGLHCPECGNYQRQPVEISNDINIVE